MELDVYIPELHLALEYQEEQHYKPMFSVTDVAAQNGKDKQKLEACRQVINLVN